MYENSQELEHVASSDLTIREIVTQILCDSITTKMKLKGDFSTKNKGQQNYKFLLNIFQVFDGKFPKHAA